MLIDSHAHIDGEAFDEDRDEVIDSFKPAGIEAVIVPAADWNSLARVTELAKKHENIYAAVGIHPHDVKDLKEEDLETIKELAKDEKVVAIGEIGLDYYYDHSPRDVQKEYFRKQIQLAKELKLPIIVHDRDSAQDVFEIISSEYDENLRGVLHSFSGSIEMAQKYLDMGFYISFAGPVTFKNAVRPKEVSKEIPLDRLLVETDSPYMTPVPYRGKRNDPTYVRYVAEKIAELKGIDFEDVAKATTENAKKLFNI